MDSNQLRVAQHRAQIAANISGSVFGETIEKGEKISIEQFQERLEKGETFLAEPQINKFMRDNQEKVVKAYTPEEKEEIIAKANSELSLLKSITVVNGIGQEFQFFTRQGQEDLIEKAGKSELSGGEWKTINGAKVYIKGGKVVAGAGGKIESPKDSDKKLPSENRETGDKRAAYDKETPQEKKVKDLTESLKSVEYFSGEKPKLTKDFVDNWLYSRHDYLGEERAKMTEAIMKELEGSSSDSGKSESKEESKINSEKEKGFSKLKSELRSYKKDFERLGMNVSISDTEDGISFQIKHKGEGFNSDKRSRLSSSESQIYKDKSDEKIVEQGISYLRKFLGHEHADFGKELNKETKSKDFSTLTEIKNRSSIGFASSMKTTSEKTGDGQITTIHLKK